MSQDGLSGVRLLVRPGPPAWIALPVPRPACSGLARARLAAASALTVTRESRSAEGMPPGRSGSSVTLASGFPSPLTAAEGRLADLLTGASAHHRHDLALVAGTSETGKGLGVRESALSGPGRAGPAVGLPGAESLLTLWGRLLSTAGGNDAPGGSSTPWTGTDGAAWSRVRPGASRSASMPLMILARDLVTGSLPADVIEIDEVSWLAWAARGPMAADPFAQGAIWGERLRGGDVPMPARPGAPPLTAEGGDLLGVVRLAADQAHLSMAFQDALGEARLEAIRELAYGAGHEINNPLANIATRAQTLLLDERDPERRRRLATIVDQAFRARDLIGGLMLFARPPRPHRGLTDVDRMVSAVVDFLAPLAAQRGARLDYGPSPEPLAVSVDRSQVEESLRAVVGNALEAVGDGGQVTVTVSAGRHPGACELMVADDGPGMDSATLRRVFDPFFSGREAGRGAGLGLSKAWRFLEANGGTIEIESRAGRGTRVLISLPLPGRPGTAPSAASEAVPEEQAVGNPCASSASSPNPSGVAGKVAAEPSA